MNMDELYSQSYSFLNYFISYIKISFYLLLITFPWSYLISGSRCFCRNIAISFLTGPYLCSLIILLLLLTGIRASSIVHCSLIIFHFSLLIWILKTKVSVSFSLQSFKSYKTYKLLHIILFSIFIFIFMSLFFYFLTMPVWDNDGICNYLFHSKLINYHWRLIDLPFRKTTHFFYSWIPLLWPVFLNSLKFNRPLFLNFFVFSGFLLYLSLFLKKHSKSRAFALSVLILILTTPISLILTRFYTQNSLTFFFMSTYVMELIEYLKTYKKTHIRFMLVLLICLSCTRPETFAVSFYIGLIMSVYFFFKKMNILSLLFLMLPCSFRIIQYIFCLIYYPEYFLILKRLISSNAVSETLLDTVTQKNHLFSYILDGIAKSFNFQYGGYLVVIFIISFVLNINKYKNNKVIFNFLFAFISVHILGVLTFYFSGISHKLYAILRISPIFIAIYFTFGIYFLANSYYRLNKIKILFIILLWLPGLFIPYSGSSWKTIVSNFFYAVNSDSLNTSQKISMVNNSNDLLFSTYIRKALPSGTIIKDYYREKESWIFNSRRLFLFPVLMSRFMNNNRYFHDISPLKNDYDVYFGTDDVSNGIDEKFQSYPVECRLFLNELSFKNKNVKKTLYPDKNFNMFLESEIVKTEILKKRLFLNKVFLNLLEFLEDVSLKRIKRQNVLNKISLLTGEMISFNLKNHSNRIYLNLNTIINAHTQKCDIFRFCVFYFIPSDKISVNLIIEYKNDSEKIPLKLKFNHFFGVGYWDETIQMKYTPANIYFEFNQQSDEIWGYVKA